MRQTKTAVLRDIRAIKARRPRLDFFALGKALSDLASFCADQREFKAELKRVAIGYRKARYLMAILETANELKLDRDRLRAIGWTKAGLLAPVLTPDNKNRWLALAETVNVVSLQDALSGDAADDGRALRSVVFKLPVKAAERLDRALLRCGGRRKGRGLANREKALMLLVRRALGAIALEDAA
jgi:hypothetical protein